MNAHSYEALRFLYAMNIINPTSAQPNTKTIAITGNVSSVRGVFATFTLSLGVSGVSDIYFSTVTVH